ncbi:ComF family protein [Virgibacillus siamensis]|uniref:ComF family protein n=1 Tax=Virgibacillus siamensis TaxID=480071 RepID=UPI000986A975|nr:ComF family protein [Virgibacillus siamensis]
MNCLWCDGEIIPEISWTTLFMLPEPENLCDMCKTELVLLDGLRCKICSRKSKASVCGDCIWWGERNDPLSFNHSVFQYNDVMQEMITQWKYRGDYALGYAFQKQYRASFRQKSAMFPKNAVLVPIPLSSERLMERGFNQAVFLAGLLTLEIKDALSRIHGEKQSKKTRYERITAGNPFRVERAVSEPVILIDDIYTTGTTLRHAATVLKENDCPEVCSFTLVRG